MGETPEVVKIACPGCETQFRLKPKKGRLPQGPVPCPKCGESIPIVEENIRRDGAPKAEAAPQAHVFSKTGNEPTVKKRNATVAGSPANTPHRSDAVSIDDADADADEFDHIPASPGLSNSDPKSTFLGMGSALQAVQGPGPRDDKTAVVDSDLLDKIRSESSVVEDDEEDDPLRETSERNDVFDRETSENKAIGPEELARNKEKKNKQDKEDQEDADDEQAPGQMVLGKIKIKKKLKRSLKKKSGQKKPTKQKAGSRAPSKPTVTDDTSPASSKPSLSSLLKKARQKKDKLSIPQPKADAAQTQSPDDGSAESLDRALDDLAKETARSIEEKHSDADADADPPAFDSGDSSMIDMLRRRVAENQQPGAASERRGSGYIRLPTAEIQDVLGHGTYRLRVEDIIYEPIDKEGLTQLVKRGVLLGAEEIAEPDGDWMPIADHPVFLELRRKMAREAHDLLKQYKPTTDADQADLPGRKAELPGRVDELPAPSTDGFDDAPELEAELEAEAEKAAKSLFSDVDAEAEATESHSPPPMPSAPQPEDPAQTTPVQPASDQASADAGDTTGDDANDADDGSSIELDYDALGVDEDDVEVTEPQPADETGSLSKRGGSMRTWLPLIAAAAVVAVLAGLAFTPIGRAILDDVSFLDGILGEQPADETVGEESSATAAADTKEQASAEAKVAITQASTVLSGALDIDPSDNDLQATVADELAKAGDYAAAARVMGVLWQHHSNDADFAARFADVLIQAGHFAQARKVAIDGLQIGSDAHDFTAVFAKAVEDNPALGAFDIVDVSADMADAASVIPDGDRVTVDLSRDGAATFRFTPAQSGWERGWRRNIATYRLCLIMVCNFDVPRTRPARIEKATYEALIENDGEGSASKLAWVTEGGKEYVYGALQDEVEGPARFPIEDTSLWRGWLSTGGDSDMEDVQAAAALDGLEGQPGAFYEPLAGQLGDTSLQKLASELSSVLVFDFLTNNWSRFQSDSEKWGTHLHLADSQLLSIHNGEAFQPRASTRIKGRFSWTSRFSEDTIASLRLMEPELVSEKLFPDASAGEKARLDVFWSQRDAALEGVDELVDAHGD
jgi:predicted Zn finger-like uncharacterized protein